MTITGWILYAFICIIAIAIFIAIVTCLYEKKEIVIAVVITATVLVLTWLGMHYYFANTESGKRSMRSQQSNLDGGLDRVVSVYSYDGKLIRQWSGKFDVTEDDQETYFDLNGKRIIIQGGIVINEEESSNHEK